MKKYAFFFIVLLPFTAAFSQEVDPVLIKGLIVTPVSEPLNDIHIYDVTSHTGTLSDEQGQFEIYVNEGDLLNITSMQYETFTVKITASMITSKRMTIYINERVNELDPVVVKAYDLSGNVNVDAAKIEVFTDFTDLDLSYKTLEFDYAFTPDAQTSTSGNTAENALLNGQIQQGADIIGGVTLLTKLIFGKEKLESAKTRKQKNSIKTYQEIKNKYTTEFITSHYNIPEDKVSDFVMFVEEQGVPYTYLKPENELLLLGHMVEVSEAYLKRKN